jgi:hypothetical protein
VQYSCDAPEDRSEAKRTFGSKPIDERARYQLADAVRKQKPAGDQSVVGITNAKLVPHYRRHHPEYRPVDIVDSSDNR